MFDLNGKLAIVTGSGSGLGRDMARGLAEAGANLIIADLDPDRGEEAADGIRQLGRRALSVPLDVSQPEQVDHLIHVVREEFPRIDVLVNNAGISVHAPTLTCPLETWRRVFDVNSTGTFLCSQAVGRVMVDEGGGCIINIASVYGHVGVDLSLADSMDDGVPGEDLAYSASKGAVVSMTRALATYWAKHKIRVNAISPGMMRTDRLKVEKTRDIWEGLSGRTPLGRPGTGKDLKGAVVYLASDASAFVTGQVLCVDGGWLAW